MTERFHGDPPDDLLANLQWHWGDAYNISHDEDGKWRAQARRLGAVMLVADDAEKLRDLIRYDYLKNG